MAQELGRLVAWLAAAVIVACVLGLVVVGSARLIALEVLAGR